VTTLATSRLRQLARSSAAQTEAALERCELCGEPIAPEHRHLLDLESRELMCSCRACSILFDRKAAGGSHFRLVPDRRLRLDGFDLDDASWAELRIPVDMAFFFRLGREDRMVALYPSPAGPTESLLELDSWQDLELRNPVLRTLEPDVEALLVNRARGAREHYLVPIEDPFRLVALIRTSWRGLTGGKEVWQQIEGFFVELSSRSKTIDNSGEGASWEASGPASRTSTRASSDTSRA
jgi:hypothetical protein